MRRNVVVAEDDWPQGESPRATSATPPQTILWSMIPATRTKKPGQPWEKRRKIHWALDPGGARVVITVAITSLDRYQVQSKMGNVG